MAESTFPGRRGGALSRRGELLAGARGSLFFKTRGWNRSLTVSDAGVQNVIDFVARSVPAAQGVSAARFIDHRYLELLGSP